MEMKNRRCPRCQRRGLEYRFSVNLPTESKYYLHCKFCGYAVTKEEGAQLEAYRISKYKSRAR